MSSLKKKKINTNKEEMAININEFSIVIVADIFNPTILNPDFLKYNGIIPAEWGWELSGSPIATPPVSSVSYSNGVNILIENKKFQIVERGESVNFEKSKIADIAKKYIEVLCHTPFKEIGINFASFIELKKPEEIIKSTFVKNGGWNIEPFALKNAGLNLSYEVNKGIFNLKINTGSIKDKQTIKNGIILNGNFHKSLSNFDRAELLDELIKYIDNRNYDFEYYNKIWRVILGEFNV